MGFGYGNTTYHNANARNLEGKPVKKTFENSMVAHVWAAQTQDFGKSGNGNFYFSGPALYSYGTHFCVGYIMPDGTALLNTDSHSVTTSAHQSNARGAVRHKTIYHVPNLTDLVSRLQLFASTREKRHAEAIKRHIREHATNRDAAAYLLRFAGERNPERTAERLTAERERAAALAIARKMADERDSRLQVASEIAKIGPAAAIKRALDRADGWNRIETLNRGALQLFHVHKAAKAAGRTKQAAAVLQVRKALRERAAWETERAAIIARNENARSSIKRIRFQLEQHKAGTLRGSYEYTQLAEAAERIHKRGRALGGLNRFTFVKLANEARAQAAVERAREIEEQERARAEREAARARAAAERFEREAADRAAWLAGESVRWHGADETGAALLRAIDVERDETGAIVSGTLETSQGAKVPLTHAIRAFRFLKLCRDAGRTWTRNGRTIRVGHFSVDRVEPTGDFRAGCHTFRWQEVERVARSLDVLDLPADESAVEAST